MRGPLPPIDGGVGPLTHVRADFRDVGFTESGVEGMLGSEAATALTRDQPAAARRALAHRTDAAAMLTSLLLIGDTWASADVVDSGVPLADLAAVGLVSDDGAHVVPMLRVEPFTSSGGDPAWVVSDFRRSRPLPANHVLGLGGAATSLARLTVRDPVASALDLGTGGGVQLVHLSHHVERLIGTDVNPRALAMARLTLGLNGLDARLVEGDRYVPVRGERFDLIVANPPMIIGAGRRFAYRDSGLDGDAMSATVARDSVAHLNDGGRCQLLAHWLHVAGQDWRERVAGWIPDATDGWVVQRDTLDPERYVDLWLGDGGDDDAATEPSRTEWLSWFHDRRVEAIGMGWISLQRTDGVRGSVRLEDLRHPVEQPVGRSAERLLATWRWLHSVDDAGLLSATLAVSADVRLSESASSSAGGPGRPTLVQLNGLQRTIPTDEFGARVVGLCDGQAPLNAVLGVACADFGQDREEILEGALEAVRGLLETGFLVPGDLGHAAPGHPPFDKPAGGGATLRRCGHL